NLYTEHPYPNLSKEDLQNIFAAELCRYRYLGLESFMRGARIADVGCGTGHRVIPLAKHFGASAYVGIDQSLESLRIANNLAKEVDLQDMIVREGDIFNIPYADQSFDIVICQGVLHHTSDPYQGFKELVRICRPGGFVNVYLFNKWNRWRHNIQKEKITKRAGADLERRFEVAHELYGKKPLAKMSSSEIAAFYDQYCHPQETEHTIAEIIGWFRNQGLVYWGSYPPLRFRDFIGMAQYRAALSKESSYFHTALAKNIVKICIK